MLNTALAYLNYGWSIFPLAPRSKVPAIPSWKKYMREKPTEALVRQWWTNTPTFNIAIVTGAISGVFVVDCDNPERVKEHEALPDYVPTLKSITAHGAHFLYQLPGFRVGNQVGNGLDIRGEGGYIVAPPSIHPSGVRYQWQRANIQPCPPNAILDQIRPIAPKPKVKPFVSPQRGMGAIYWAHLVLTRELDRLASTSKGGHGLSGRNDQLNRSAYNLGQLVGDGLLSSHEVESALYQVAIAIGLGERETEKTIASGLNAGLANPRSMRAKGN